VRIYLSVVLTVLFLSGALWGVTPRSPSWKPVFRTGAQQLSFDEISTLAFPTEPGIKMAAAISDLQELYTERYGTSLAVVYGVAPKHSLSFKIDASVGEGGAFVIDRRRTRAVVRGADESAWSNALYSICSDLMGARWYWSGSLGFEWTEPEKRFFPNYPWRGRPSFVERRFSPHLTDYARRNRLNRMYAFNHNLAKVFDPDAYEQDPELFAEVNGRRNAPRGHRATDPQPDFTYEGSVELAARAALDFFEEHPQARSFSLSINDNVLFDTRARTEAAVTPLRFFRRRPDYTDLVFGFMNRVAERVFDQGGAWTTVSGEKRYLTALAYYWTEPAPSIKIHPRVMPVLTSDRAQWHDSDYRSEDEALIREWTRSGAERVATWDYYFGAPYLYPRQFNQWMDASLKTLSDAGVEVFFTQLPAFWGLDGAKAWLASELLWDANQDMGKLLDEYYHEFFGPAAAPMRAFYEKAERHRNAHEGEADWIKLYKDEAGIALFTEDVLKELRLSLDTASGKVDPDTRFARRVEVVSQAFELTERYAAYDTARRDLVRVCLRKARYSKAEIHSRLEYFREMRAAYESYFENFLDTEYAPPRGSIELSQSNPEAFALGVLDDLDARELVSRLQDPNLGHYGSRARNFLGPNVPVLKDWWIDFRPSENFKLAREGSQSGLFISNADIASVFSVFPVLPNHDYALRCEAAWQISLDNRAHVEVIWLDREGKTLERNILLRFPIGASRPVESFTLPFKSPAGAHSIRARIVTSRQYSGDFLEIQRLDFGVLMPLAGFLDR
jgi:hypothetical protein